MKVSEFRRLVSVWLVCGAWRGAGVVDVGGKGVDVVLEGVDVVGEDVSRDNGDVAWEVT